MRKQAYSKRNHEKAHTSNRGRIEPKSPLKKREAESGGKTLKPKEIKRDDF
jgi:hypothetical protein